MLIITNVNDSIVRLRKPATSITREHLPPGVGQRVTCQSAGKTGTYDHDHCLRTAPLS